MGNKVEHLKHFDQPDRRICDESGARRLENCRQQRSAVHARRFCAAAIDWELRESRKGIRRSGKLQKNLSAE